MKKKSKKKMPHFVFSVVPRIIRTGYPKEREKEIKKHTSKNTACTRETRIVKKKIKSYSLNGLNKTIYP